MLKGSENVVTGPPLTLISIVKPKRGVGSHVEKGWDPPGPTASHRTRFGSHVEKSWDPPGPTEPDLGAHRREELGPTGSHRVHVGMRARLVGLRARLWVQKMFMLPAST